MNVTRREFLRTTAVLGAATSIRSGATPRSSIPGEQGRFGPLIDVNISLGQWPFRRLLLDETLTLVRTLEKAGVRQAWAGSFEALLHKDIGAVNDQLSAECRDRGRGLLVPFGSVNPKLPDWEEEVRRCAEVHAMPGLRLYPNYHGYKLGDPLFEKLLDIATTRKMLIQIAVGMEDERMQHPLMRVSDVDLNVLPELLTKVPGAKVILLNWFRASKPELLARLAERVWFDMAMLEGVAGIENLLNKLPVERLLFGSHAPFYYFESGVLKIKESELTLSQQSRIRHQNATELLRAR